MQEVTQESRLLVSRAMALPTRATLKTIPNGIPSITAPRGNSSRPKTSCFRSMAQKAQKKGSSKIETAKPVHHPARRSIDSFSGIICFFRPNDGGNGAATKDHDFRINGIRTHTHGAPQWRRAVPILMKRATADKLLEPRIARMTRIKPPISVESA